MAEKQELVEQPVLKASDNLWNLSKNGISTDCIIEVLCCEPPKVFKLHKMILVNSSPVFETMFEIDMKEKRTGTVQIDDIDPRIMEIALKHLYACEFDEGLTCEDVRDLLFVADKYQINTLKEVCAEYANNYLVSPANVLFLLNLKHYFNDSVVSKNKLEIQLLKMLEDETKKCLTGDDKLEINEDTVVQVLKLKQSNLESEFDFIKFVNSWALNKFKPEDNVEFEDNNKLRKLLEPNILPMLHFLTLNKDEFLEFLCISNWLTTVEKKEISNFINAGTYSSKFPPFLSSNTTSNRCKKNNISNLLVGFPDPCQGETIPVNSVMVNPAKSTLICIKELEFAYSRYGTHNYSYGFHFQVDSECALAGVQVFTVPTKNDTLNDAMFYNEYRSILITLNNEILVDSRAYEGLARYNSCVTTLFVNPIPIKKNVAYYFQSSYTTIRYMKYLEPINEINFYSNTGSKRTIRISGDIGCLRAFIFK